MRWWREVRFPTQSQAEHGGSGSIPERLFFVVYYTISNLEQIIVSHYSTTVHDLDLPGR